MIYLHPTLTCSPKKLEELQNATQCSAIWVDGHLCQLIPNKKQGAAA
ncbi:hypothetical protein [Bermanella sp. R86510]